MDNKYRRRMKVGGFEEDFGLSMELENDVGKYGKKVEGRRHLVKPNLQFNQLLLS